MNEILMTGSKSLCAFCEQWVFLRSEMLYQFEIAQTNDLKIEIHGHDSLLA